MSELSQPRWDAMRFELLGELAEVVAVMEGNAQALDPFIEACTLAFDRPAPKYTIYNRLRSFKAGAWPLLREVVRALNPQEPVPQDVIVTLASATTLLSDANALRDSVATDALEVQLAVLQQLLAEYRP